MVVFLDEITEKIPQEAEVDRVQLEGSKIVIYAKKPNYFSKNPETAVIHPGPKHGTSANGGRQVYRVKTQHVRRWYHGRYHCRRCNHCHRAGSLRYFHNTGNKKTHNNQ